MGVWTEPLAQTRPGSAGLSWRDRRKGRERREGLGEGEGWCMRTRGAGGAGRELGAGGTAN